MSRTILFTVFLVCVLQVFSQKNKVALQVDVIPAVFQGETQSLLEYVEDVSVVNERSRPEKIGYHPKGDWVLNQTVNPNAKPQGWDPVHQKEYSRTRNTKSVGQNFAGGAYSSVNPADPTVDVGPNHVVQMINAASGSYIYVWNKSGTVLSSQVYFDNFMGMGGGLGDPIVLYDERADRWLLSEFSASGNNMHVAISTTANPMGSYYTYTFNAPSFPDYPKYSIWEDAYVITTNETTSAVYALDRTSLLAGVSSLAQRFSMTNFGTIGFQAATPVSLNGTTLPPSGAPAMVMRMRDDAWSGAATDALEIWEFDIDWINSTNTSLTLAQVLPIAAYESELCGYTSFACIPQPNSNTTLDPLREVLMNRIHYRNFGTHESIVCCHVADVDGSDWAGMRWYELRRSNGTSGTWSIYQQGNYAPDTDDRWMGSIAISASGNIGLAYNVSSGSTYPSIRYTGRKVCDPLGMMTEPETTLAAGAGSNASNRYGDYNTLVVDPSDGETFWFTGKYNASSQWSTKVSSFDLGTCDPIIQFSVSSYSVNEGDANVPNGCLDYYLLDVPITIAMEPSAATDVVVSVTGGLAVEGVDFDIVSGAFQFTSNVLSHTVQLKVYNDDYVEGTEDVQLSYTFNANGGDAISGTINQSVTIDIEDNDFAPSNTFINTTLLEHDFETGMAPFTTNNPSGDDAWAVGSASVASSSYFTVPSSNATQIAWVNDDDCNCNQNSVDLIFPVVDLSSCTSAQLTFDSYYEDNSYLFNNEDADLLVSIGGGSFVTISELVASTNSNWIQQDFDISSYCGNSSVQFKINYSDAGGWLYGCAIDNVVITGNSVTGIQTAVDTTMGHTASLGANGSVYFYDPTTGNIIMQIENSGAWDYGCVTVEVDRDGTVPSALPFTTNNPADFLMSKTVKVSVANPNPLGSYVVTLFYEEAEVAAWEAITGNLRDSAKVIKVADASVGSVNQTNYSLFSIEAGPTTIGSFQSGVSFSALFSGEMVGFGMGLAPSLCDAFTVDSLLVGDSDCGPSNGFISIQTVGGTGTVQYSMDGGSSFQTTNVFEGLMPGSYSIEIKDGANCLLSASAVVEPGLPNPIPQLQYDTVVTMQPDTLVLMPGPFDSYLWSTGATSSLLFVDDFGTYYITVTENGCQGVDSAVIGERQDILLNQGWGLYSTYINTSDSVKNLFRDLYGNLIIVKDELGHVYWPAFNFDNIGSHTVGKSYLVKMTNAGWWVVNGDAAVPELSVLNLNTGFGHLGYLRKQPAPVSTIMSSVTDKIVVMKNGLGHVYWPLYQLDMIGNMVPGDGYQIKMLGDTVFTYPPNSVAFSKTNIDLVAPKKFTNIEPSSTSMTLGIPYSAWEYKPQTGDELAVFDLQHKLVGAGVIGDGDFALTIWGDDDLTLKKDGMVDLEPFSLEIWQAATGQTYPLIVEGWTEGDQYFAEHKISVAGNVLLDLEETFMLKCFPNPFTGQTSVQFKMQETSRVVIELFTNEGRFVRKVIDRDLPPGNHSVVLKQEELASGAYFVRLKTNKRSESHSVQIME